MGAPRRAMIWCERCGGRTAAARIGGDWICRWCVRNRRRRPLPSGTPRARDRYRAAGLCVRCGAERDRPDRLHCSSCRRLHAAATARHRAIHPRDRVRLYADVRARRQRYIAAGLCADCGGKRDRADRRLCERCRARAAEKTVAYRRRRDEQQQAAV